MGQAYITRRGGQGTLITEIFASSGTFVARTNKVFVRLFGAGGGGKAAGGGGGHMVVGELEVVKGQSYPVTIGVGSIDAGGVTSFGTLLSASGGSAGSTMVGGDGGSGGGGCGDCGGSGSYGGIASGNLLLSYAG